MNFKIIVGNHVPVLNDYVFKNTENFDLSSIKLLFVEKLLKVINVYTNQILECLLIKLTF